MTKKDAHSMPLEEFTRFMSYGSTNSHKREEKEIRIFNAAKTGSELITLM
jgi:hypothetical protein